MNTKQVELANGVLDWWLRQRRVELGTFMRDRKTRPFVKQQLRQARVDRDAQLALIASVKSCGCGRCGR